jgi:hypothetical protein
LRAALLYADEVDARAGFMLRPAAAEDSEGIEAAIGPIG